MGTTVARTVSAGLLTGIVTLAGAPAIVGAPAGATTLPACPIIANLPTKPVPAAVRTAITRYYSVRKMLPVTIYNNRETVLNVKTFSAGVHWCRNLDGGKSGYVGMVPAKALAAVMVHVKHKAYAVTMSASTFMTLVQMPGTGWKVVSDDTAP
ncbi:MAG: hypothetical protein KGJ36_03445 [Acidobacteriota bacterium]|nr:hypothetical protein [Acidobacteriota bacterium]